MKSTLKKILFLLWLFLLAAHCILLLWIGVASVLTMLLFYGTFFFLLNKLVAKALPRYNNVNNLRLSLWAMCAGLLAGELLLRYIFQTHAAYGEKSGRFFYASPFLQCRQENLFRKLSGQHDVGLFIGQPFDSVQNHNTPEFQFTHVYNSLGLRDREYTRQQLDTSAIILALGDSFTEGVGAAQDSTWARQLEALFTPLPPPRICLIKT